MSTAQTKISSALFAATLTLASPSLGGENPGPLGSAAEVIECLRRNAPATTSAIQVEFKSIDRVGEERVTRANLKHKLFDDSLRRVVLRFTKPNDLRGTAFLLIENPGGSNDMFLYSPDLRREKRISGSATRNNLFGMDFSAEDLERWWSMNHTGEAELLPDGVVSDREVYVVSTTPDPELSGYVKVVAHVDKRTCVALKVESFEEGEQARKVLLANPDQVLEVAGRHVATELVQRDLLDETRTEVVVEDVAFDVEIRDREFMVSRLAKD